MTTMQGSEPAPGGPGIAPTWSSSAKDAIGTSTGSSRIWFTVGRGIVNEVYWPRVDSPQIRDLGFIVADEAGFWSEVKRDARHEVSYLEDGVPAVVVKHRHDRYELELRICTDVHADVVRIQAKLRDLATSAGGGPGRVAGRLRLYPLIAPHLGFTGIDNTAWAGAYKGLPMLFARKGAASLALAAEPAPSRISTGYVGSSDGWQDFADDGRMTWTYDSAGPGNVAGMLEVEPADDGRVELALAFGARTEEAGLLARWSVVTDFNDVWQGYVDGWRGARKECTAPSAELDAKVRTIYLNSAAVLRSHQDRTSPGATVASLSIPWGNSRNDLGGYHLVWSRDLVETAGALIAIGAAAAARWTLAYLASTQEPDGHWIQNQWVDGVAYWTGIQLDESAYPILLVNALRSGGASRMHGQHARGDEFEGLLTALALEEMACKAAGFLVRNGPATQQDRWEENAGLTPSTLAPVIAALVAAASILDEPSARYCLELAQDWNASIEDWTYADGGGLAGQYGVDGYYVRIASPDVLNGAPISTTVPIKNRPPGENVTAADRMVGTDFLALVRFGLRRADDPRILNTIKIADALLRVETPNGPAWHRYTGDGYGEHADGSPYDGTGIGRAWPLLVGERGHYELQAGHDVHSYLSTMASMSSSAGMIPEQVWDTSDIPEAGLFCGHPSGSAMPLAWAHAEFVKLARSIALGRPIDQPDGLGGPEWTSPKRVRATWRFGQTRPTMPQGVTLRLELLAACRVRFSLDGWASWTDIDAKDTRLGIWFADIPGSADLANGGAVDFTFWWSEPEHWEGANYRVAVVGT